MSRLTLATNALWAARRGNGPKQATVYFRTTPIECKRPRKPVERRSDRTNGLPRDRPRVTGSDHDGAFIIALFNSPCLRSALRPWAARLRTAGHASVAGPPENSPGCPAWRLRPVAQRSAGPASGAGYPAMRLQHHRSRDHRLGRRMLLGVRANAGGLAA